MLDVMVFSSIKSSFTGTKGAEPDPFETASQQIPGIDVLETVIFRDLPLHC